MTWGALGGAIPGCWAALIHSTRKLRLGRPFWPPLSSPKNTPMATPTDTPQNPGTAGAGTPDTPPDRYYPFTRGCQACRRGCTRTAFCRMGGQGRKPRAREVEVASI